MRWVYSLSSQFNGFSIASKRFGAWNTWRHPRLLNDVYAKGWQRTQSQQRTWRIARSTIGYDICGDLAGEG
jgi:hypothetical protein